MNTWKTVISSYRGMCTKPTVNTLNFEQLPQYGQILFSSQNMQNGWTLMMCILYRTSLFPCESFSAPPFQCEEMCLSFRYKEMEIQIESHECAI